MTVGNHNLCLSELLKTQSAHGHDGERMAYRMPVRFWTEGPLASLTPFETPAWNTGRAGGFNVVPAGDGQLSFSLVTCADDVEPVLL